VRRIAAFSFLLFFLARATALAQAWVPERGEGTVSVTYQHYDVAGHYDVKGQKNNNGGTRSHSAVVEFDYGLTDTTALLVSVPFIASKYTGPPSYFVGPNETFPGPLDDGSYHGAFQDLRVELRRLFWAGPMAVAPFAGASFPTHEYETVGEAVPGRHRKDFHAGVNVGLDLGRVLGSGYVSARYAYAVNERMSDHPFTRSNIDLEVGYPALPRVVLRGVINRQIRHQGPTIAELSRDWLHHDRFMAPSYLNLGAGASVRLTNSMDVFGLWLGTVSGNSGAHRARALTFGVSVAVLSGLRGLGGDNAADP
jgi:hypothetical protein